MARGNTECYCWEALPAALATCGGVLLDLLLIPPLQKGGASCKAKHVPSSWWAPHRMASLNNPHQQQHSHLAAPLRSEPSAHVAHTPLLNEDLCIYSLQTGLTRKTAMHLSEVFWPALLHAATPLKGGVEATGTRGLRHKTWTGVTWCSSVAPGLLTQPHDQLATAHHHMRECAALT